MATLLPTSRNRIYSLDILRGAVMILMALDHTRDFFHFDASLHDPVNLPDTSVYLFLTRWITHLCAPTFVFLAGISAFLQSERKTKKDLSAFLIKRGLWLILIEVTVVTFAWTFDPAYHVLALQVIWAIGFSMTMMGLIIWLPMPLIFFLGAIITLGHNALDYTSAMQGHNTGFFFDLLLRGNFQFHEFASGHTMMMVYAGIPWLGVMLLGYCFGTVYKNGSDWLKRKRTLLITALGLLIAFFILRGFNLYGDPTNWAMQQDGIFSFLSLINVTKYPPSLLFLCATLGISILFLAFAEKWNNRFTQAISVYGRVPFFYYILHLYLIHGIEMILYLMRGHSFAEGAVFSNDNFFRFFKPGEGYHLWQVYLIWIALVIVLYPLCKWFNDYKTKHRVWWMSYL